jgi:hypothetical protein
VSKGDLYDRIAARRGIGGAGRRAERKTAKRVSGRERPASGARDGYKGDIELPTFLLENKSTQNESLSLKYEWLRKITKEAMCDGKMPALSLHFTDASGNPRDFGTFVLIPEHVFKAIAEGAE